MTRNLDLADNTLPVQEENHILFVQDDSHTENRLQLFFINLLQSQDGTHVHSPLHIGFSNYKTATNYLIGSLSRDMSSTLFGA